jgi:PPIC-type peptidyl-prolyl cis-trans isomerase-like protein
MSGKPTRLCGLVLAVLRTGVFGPQLRSQTSPPVQNAPSNEVPLQVIMVRSPEEAQAVMEQRKKGANFSNLAQEKSIDPTAQAGGFMGKFAPNSLRGELRDAIQGLGPGQFTSPVHIPSGYAIVKIMEEESSRVAKDADPARNFALAATGTVKYAPDLDGLGGAEAAIRQFPKTPGWNSDPQVVYEFRKKSLEEITATAKEVLAPVSQYFAGHPPIDAMQAHLADRLQQRWLSGSSGFAWRL